MDELNRLMMIKSKLNYVKKAKKVKSNWIGSKYLDGKQNYVE